MRSLLAGTGFDGLVRDFTDQAMIALGAGLTGPARDFGSPVHPDVAILCAAGLGAVRARTRELAAVWIAAHGHELLSWSGLGRVRKAAAFGEAAERRIDEVLSQAAAAAPALQWTLERPHGSWGLKARASKGLVELPVGGWSSFHVRLRALAGPTVRAEVIAALLTSGRRRAAGQLAWDAMVPTAQVRPVLAALSTAGWVRAIETDAIRYEAGPQLTALTHGVKPEAAERAPRPLHWRAILGLLATIDAHTHDVPPSVGRTIELHAALTDLRRELVELDLDPPGPAAPGQEIAELVRTWIRDGVERVRSSLGVAAV